MIDLIIRSINALIDVFSKETGISPEELKKAINSELARIDVQEKADLAEETEVLLHGEHKVLDP